MIEATEKIIKTFEEDKMPQWEVVHALVDCVLKFGSKDDADTLIDCFLENPTDYKRAELLNVVNHFGDVSHSEKLLDNCFDGLKLKSDYVSEILKTLGYLKNDKALEILTFYGFNSESHSESCNAVLGLLHFDCQSIQNEILREIEKTYNKNLFNEFVPALVCKLDEKEEILGKLFHYGSTITSTDCNAGIFLGFALSGKLGESYFKKAFWSQAWEADGSGTGTRYWSYLGTQILGWKINDIYQNIKTESDEKKLRQKLYLLYGLLEKRISDNFFYPLKFIKPPEESFEEIFQSLFAWESPNEANNVISLATKVDLYKEFWEIERKVEWRMRQEFLEKYSKAISS